MSENEPLSGGAVATAEPPQKPPAAPTTATAAPRPPRRKRSWIGWTVGLLVALLIVGGLAWLIWSQRSPQSAASTSKANASAFASAMKKAGVSAPADPASPVDLATVTAQGSHRFDATFTGEELSALMNSFPHAVTVGNAPMSLSDVTIQIDESGVMTLSGHVSSQGNSYSGQASGEVAFEGGEVVAPTPLTVSAEGFTLNGNQAQQATQLLLAYANGYLAAAPGLTIATATPTPSGVHATGTAPDSISW